MAGSDNTPWVAMAEMSAAPPLGQELGCGTDGAGGVDHVVDQDAVAPLDLTDDVEGLHLVVGAPGPALVHEGQVRPRGVG